MIEMRIVDYFLADSVTSKFIALCRITNQIQNLLLIIVLGLFIQRMLDFSFHTSAMIAYVVFIIYQHESGIYLYISTWPPVTNFLYHIAGG